MKIFDRFKGDQKMEKKEGKAKAPRAKVEASNTPTTEKKQKTIEHGESEAAKVLVRPVVSEKVARLEPAGQYVFEVASGVGKVEVKKAVEKHYRVTVKKVNILKVHGKKVTRGRVNGRRKDWHKAYVTLKKGETLVY